MVGAGRGGGVVEVQGGVNGGFRRGEVNGGFKE